MRVRSGAAVVEVVSCPENFYPRGSFFLATEFFGSSGKASTTIDQGWWIPGMVIETAEGERYRVKGEQMEPQELVPVEDRGSWEVEAA